jgi:hypothetical protein
MRLPTRAVVDPGAIPAERRVITPGVAAPPVTRAGAQPSGVRPANVCDTACEIGRQACHASPVPNFICDAAADACHRLC